MVEDRLTPSISLSQVYPLPRTNLSTNEDPSILVSALIVIC
jgi:hypothetical protein